MSKAREKEYWENIGRIACLRGKNTIKFNKF